VYLGSFFRVHDSLASVLLCLRFSTEKKMRITGLGGGFDTGNLLDQLMQLEKQKLYRLQQREYSVTQEISATGRLTQTMTAIEGALKPFQNDTGFFNNSINLSIPNSTSTSRAADETIAVYADGTARTALHDVLVSSVAESRRVKSEVITAGSQLRGMTIDIQAHGGTQQTFTFADDATLEEIAEAINTSGATMKASVVADNDGNEALTIESTATGSDSGFAFDPASTGSTAATPNDPSDEFLDGDDGMRIFVSYTGTNGFAELNLAETRASANAQITVDGVTLDSKTNMFDSVLSGVSIEALAVNSEVVEIDIKPDNSEFMEDVTSLVTSINKAIYTFSVGELKGTSIARLGMSDIAITTATTSVDTGTEYSTLSALGITTDRSSGELVFDTSLLTVALQDTPESVEKIFDGTATETGFIANLEEMLEGYLILGDENIIKGRKDSLEREKKSLQSSIERENYRLEGYERRMVMKFAQLEALMAESNNQPNFAAMLPNINYDRR
jgi:flagellar hook-associated protein 2